MPSRSTALASLLAIGVVVSFAFVALRPRPVLDAEQAPSALVGQSAPDFTLLDLAGTPVTLSALRGHVVVLDVWATWCPPCVVELPTNAAVAKKYAGRGVVFYAVNLGETPGTVQAFLDRRQLDAPVLMDVDKTVAAKYEAEYIPLLVVIDGSGRVVAHGNVEPSAAEATLSRWIESALESGQAEERASQRPATRP